MSDIQTISQGNYILQMPPASSYMNLSGLEYDGDKISGYAGSAFKAGDEFPQSATDAIGYVTATSGDINSTVNNVSTNSAAWGGSALPISAGTGVKISLQNDMLVFSTDETVLWENTNSAFTIDLQWPQTLSEPITNFEKVEFLYSDDGGIKNAQYHVFNAYNNFDYNLVAWRCDGPTNDNIFWREAKFNCNGTSLTNPYNSTINLTTGFNGVAFNRSGYNCLLKVVGINRKEV